MVGRFILSLDCEGKWGIADHLTLKDHARLSDERIRHAYSAIIALLAQHGISATFAVTECFLLSRDELLSLPMEEIAERLPYTRPAFDDVRSGTCEGWSAPWLREQIESAHELACHGGTHAPWGALSEEQARFDLSLFPQTRGRTFIHPRNQVAHLGVLRDHGFAGYRMAPTPCSRIASLASEANLRSRAQPDQRSVDDLQPIPSGYFINWMAGPRRLVPTALTRARARRILLDAARTGGVAHFWSHPENIASAPRTLDNLAAIVEEAAALRRSGRIVVGTQRDYCLARVQSAAAAAGSIP